MFYKIRLAIARFMYGRNGPDQLTHASIWAILIVELLSMLIQGRKAEPMLLSIILHWVVTAGWIWVFFRIFSKNLPKRRLENQKWLQWWWHVKNAVSGAKARHADKDHKYFTCKNCKAICRVPAGKGKIVITCPKCGAKIQAKT